MIFVEKTAREKYVQTFQISFRIIILRKANELT